MPWKIIHFKKANLLIYCFLKKVTWKRIKLFIEKVPQLMRKMRLILIRKIIGSRWHKNLLVIILRRSFNSDQIKESQGPSHYPTEGRFK